MVRKSVEVRVEEVIHETEAAYLFLIEGQEYWCPKSQVVQRVCVGELGLTVDVSEWWLKKRSPVDRVGMDKVKAALRVQTVIAEELSELSPAEAQEVLKHVRRFLDEQFGPQDVGEKGGE